MNRRLLAPFALAALLAPTGADAAVYLFTASCDGGKKIVEQWTTEGTDHGKEFLRSKTQEKHPGCSIGDYKAATDNMALKNTQFYSTAQEGADDSGVPVVGPMWNGAKKSLCGVLGC
ncbi:MAG TPA: hypothetical protein VEH77_13070 [Roseiarcus sp.]|nr:hypothetical protein [Roseiarcus sp.]